MSELNSVSDLRVLLSREAIAKRVARWRGDYARFRVNPSFCLRAQGRGDFSDDLARQVPLDATFDFIGVSSYGTTPIAKEDPAGHAAWIRWAKCA